MKKSLDSIKQGKNYIFSTSIDYSEDPDDFIIELFYADDEELTQPKKIIHNFDELISFFENLDEDQQMSQIKRNKWVKKD